MQQNDKPKFDACTNLNETWIDIGGHLRTTKRNFTSSVPLRNLYAQALVDWFTEQKLMLKNYVFPFINALFGTVRLTLESSLLSYCDSSPGQMCM